MTDTTNDRKIEHIRAFDLDPDIDRHSGGFDSVRLIHRALPQIDLADVDPSTEFLGKRLSFPLLISSMTGGNHQLVRTVNRNLAIAAEHCQVAMAVGSQRVMFVDPQAAESFQLRQYAPSVPLLGNIGAVQLNNGFGHDQVRKSIEVLQADGLYLHLNPLQEAVQPEGDTNFGGLIEQIAKLNQSIETPLLFKEVGAGLGPQDVELGLQAGIRYFDVAGTGGTSWSRIEYHRRKDPGDDLGLRFQDWGLDTVTALRQVAAYQDRATLIASGGIRDGIDMAKSVILGASLCGVAAPLLKPAMESPEAVIAQLERLRREFTTAMFLLGVSDVATLHNNHSLMLEKR